MCSKYPVKNYISVHCRLKGFTPIWNCYTFITIDKIGNDFFFTYEIQNFILPRSNFSKFTSLFIDLGKEESSFSLNSSILNETSRPKLAGRNSKEESFKYNSSNETSWVRHSGIRDILLLLARIIFNLRQFFKLSGRSVITKNKISVNHQVAKFHFAIIFSRPSNS